MSYAASRSRVDVAERPFGRWVCLLPVALGVGIAVNSALGPFITEVIRYRVSETLRSQTVALDAVSLLLVAPLSIAAGVLALRAPADVRPRMLALPPALFVLYMIPQYVVGPDYLRLPGNNEAAFPLHLALFVLGMAVAVTSWNAVVPERLPPPSRPRLVAGVLVALVLFLVVRYLPTILGSQPATADYREGPTFFWVIALLDLGVAVTAMVAAAAGLLVGARWAGKAAYAITGWFALVAIAVAAMALVMYVNDDPGSSGGAVATFAVAAFLLTAAALGAHVPLFRRDRRTGRAA